VKPTDELTANGTYFSFVGTYKYFDGTTNTSPIVSGDYIVNTGGIVKASGENQLKAFRAYLQQQSSSDGARAVRLDIGGTATTIADITDGAQSNDATYNLRGQRIDRPTQKGIYISGGKKMVIK